MLRDRAAPALRAALGLAIAGELLLLLAVIGALRPSVIGALCVVAIVAARRWWIGLRWRPIALGSLVVLPLLVLTLYPPIAFDETLYHLPFVRAMANTGRLDFLPDLRFPLFPQLHEALSVPLFLALGDTATHLAALAELIVLAALLVSWPRDRAAGWLAAALFIGSPIVIQLGTVTHTELALTLFVAAGTYTILCRETWTDIAAGLLLGAACSVKYLGWYFAVGGLLYLLLFGEDRRRRIGLFLAGLAAGVLPMYATLFLVTGNPVFPFFFGHTPWTFEVAEPVAPLTRVLRAVRLPWDITFARERLNLQPHYSPFVAAAALITCIVALRNRRAAFLAALTLGYIAIFTFLPQDSRYLLPLVPPLCVVAATAMTTWIGARRAAALAVLAIAPGLAYAGYRIARQGLPPATAIARRDYLASRIPAFRALEHRGPGRIYVCGAEQLKYYGGDDLLGDVVGAYATNKTLTGDVRQSLRHIGARYLLIVPAQCSVEPVGLTRVYADESAQLWRVE